MDCRTNCPKVCEFAETSQDLSAELTQVRALLEQNEALDQENRRSASLLAGLPNNRDTAEARSYLQDAVIKGAEASEQCVNSINLFELAIDANTTAADALMGVCPGQPVEVPDPTRPGHMILSCASRALSDELDR